MNWGEQWEIPGKYIFRRLVSPSTTLDEKHGSWIRMKNKVIKNGNICELGNDGITLRNCIPGRLVHIWVIGCSNTSYHCNGCDGDYPIQIDTWDRLPLIGFLGLFGSSHSWKRWKHLPPESKKKIREPEFREQTSNPEQSLLSFRSCPLIKEIIRNAITCFLPQ